MGVEITFRRALFGGFNRGDVMKYINTVAVANNDQQKVVSALTDAKVQIETLKAQLDATKTELEAKTKELDYAKQEFDALKKATEETIALAMKEETPPAEEKNDSVVDKTADQLMLESMAYADKYIESANLVASNIRKDTLERAKEADSRVAAMLEKAALFSKETENFEETLGYFKSQLEGVIKGFTE